MNSAKRNKYICIHHEKRQYPRGTLLRKFLTIFVIVHKINSIFLLQSIFLPEKKNIYMTRIYEEKISSCNFGMYVLPHALVKYIFW